MNESNPPPTKDDRKLHHKDLRDEVQLYWLIQLGTITALGALMGTWPKEAPAASGDAILVKLTVLLVGLVLVTIAGMYNVVGNYYTFAANYRLGRSLQQESVVTPWLARAQSLIAASLGAAVGAVAYEGLATILPQLGWWFGCIAYCGGAAAGYVIYGWSVATVIESFHERSCDPALVSEPTVLNMIQGFIAYSQNLQRMQIVTLGRWTIGRAKWLEDELKRRRVSFR